MQPTVGFIGFGNMARAIAEGLTRAGFPKEKILASVRSERSRERLQREGFKVLPPEEVFEKSQILFLATKPKDLPAAVKPFKDHPQKGEKIFISVAAGVSLQKLKDLLGEDSKIVRTMPNVNVAVGKGVWGVAYSENLTPAERERVKELLEKTGLVVELDEGLMDAITALAGSAPAFIAEIVDAFAEAGVKLGFKYPEALKIALYTFTGTLQLMEESGEHPILLRDKVTSPAGTTIYGLSKLHSEGVKGKLIEVIEEAYKRARKWD